MEICAGYRVYKQPWWCAVLRLRRQRHSAVPFCLPPRFSPQHADINHREDVALTDSWISQHARWEKTSFFSASLQQIPNGTACSLILKRFPGLVLYSRCFIMAYDVFLWNFKTLFICFWLNYCVSGKHCIISIIFVWIIFDCFRQFFHF